jgi:hypothetical protein
MPHPLPLRLPSPVCLTPPSYCHRAFHTAVLPSPHQSPSPLRCPLPSLMLHCHRAFHCCCCCHHAVHHHHCCCIVVVPSIVIIAAALPSRLPLLSPLCHPLAISVPVAVSIAIAVVPSIIIIAVPSREVCRHTGLPHPQLATCTSTSHSIQRC